MGKDSAPRWAWIQENVTFNEKDEFIKEVKN
jgi:hypothetical protein